ncbi:MAG: DUF4232 domain-containing protein [Terracidiphilus sp.]
MSHLNLEIDLCQRRWRVLVTFLPIWCALAVLSRPATAQSNAPQVSSCKASQLSVAEDRKESEEMYAGAGNQAATISIQNRSPSACVLQGVPGMTLLDASNHPFSTRVCSNCGDYLFHVQSVKRILLEPNKSAYVVVGYLSECRNAETLSVHISDQKGALNITLAGMAAPSMADGVQICGTVNITPYLEKPPVGGDLPPEN